MYESMDRLPVPDPMEGAVDLVGLVWVDPAEREPSADPALDTDGWDTALRQLVLSGISESDAHAANPLLVLEDTDLVGEAVRSERAVRAETARGYAVAAELARRRPEPSGDPDERGLSAYALDEIALATGLARGAVAFRVAEADALTTHHPSSSRRWPRGCWRCRRSGRCWRSRSPWTPPDPRRCPGTCSTASVPPTGCGWVK